MKIRFQQLSTRCKDNTQRWIWYINDSPTSWHIPVPIQEENYERAVEALERVVNEDKILSGQADD